MTDQRAEDSTAARFAGQIHTAVANSARRLEVLHAEEMQCRRGCHDCCVDDITVFALEAARIAVAHPALLAKGQPHPTGACAFLNIAGACRVYHERPYVCRTQGLPLRWLDGGPDGQTTEYRDICPLNDAIPVTSLPAAACWSLGRTESLLQQAQHQLSGDQRRVSLRSLFRRGG